MTTKVGERVLNLFLNPAVKNRGATLIELMIAIGIMGTLVIAGASLSQMVASSAQSLNLRNNENALASIVRQRVESGESCGSAIGGLTLPAGGNWTNTTGLEVTMNVPTVDGTTLAAGTVLPLQGLRVKSLRLQEGRLASSCGNGTIQAGEQCDPGAPANHANCTSACRCNPSYDLVGGVPGTCTAPATPAPPTAGNPTVEYIGKLYMEVEKLNSGGGGMITSLQGLVGPLIFQRDLASGVVSSCKSTVNMPEADICTKVMGCSYDPAAPSDKCICPPYMKGCTDPATYPVAVEGGVLICKPLGGTCGPGQVLNGIAVGQVWCMNEPAILPYYSLSCVSDGSCGASASCTPAAGVYPMNDVVAVTASVQAGFSIASWSGGTNADGANPSLTNAVTMDNSKTVLFSCMPTPLPPPPPPPPAPPPPPSCAWAWNCIEQSSANVGSSCSGGYYDSATATWGHYITSPDYPATWITGFGAPQVCGPSTPSGPTPFVSCSSFEVESNYECTCACN